MLKLDGLVVLYNPDDTVWLNIQSYLTYVDLLYVVDNSEQKNLTLIEKIQGSKNAVYINNEANLGIASALNRGAKEALLHGAAWLLTMDQDSCFDGTSLQTLVAFAHSLPKDHQVGVLSPVHKTVNASLPMVKDNMLTVEVDSVMTSGNLINLMAFESVGGFLDKYFIDCVDHEYCLRLKKSGFKIILHQGTFLEHNLGDIKQTSFLGKKIYYTNHSPIRRYYITRNRLDVIFRYGKAFPYFSSNEVKKFFSEWLKILLFEKNKLTKTFFILKGCKDFVIRRFGKL